MNPGQKSLTIYIIWKHFLSFGKLSFIYFILTFSVTMIDIFVFLYFRKIEFIFKGNFRLTEKIKYRESPHTSYFSEQVPLLLTSWIISTVNFITDESKLKLFFPYSTQFTSWFTLYCKILWVLTNAWCHGIYHYRGRQNTLTALNNLFALPINPSLFPPTLIHWNHYHSTVSIALFFSECQIVGIM